MIENFDTIKSELRCCVVNKAWLTAHQDIYGIEDADCEQKALLINAKFQIVDRYIEVGRVTILSVDASADIDLTGLVLGDGMSGTIYVDIAGNVTFIASFSGDFAGLTLSDFIDALIAAMIAGGSGFTGTNNDPILTVTAPLNLGANPIGSTVYITLAPTYYLRYERTSPAVTGFTTGIGFPAFVNDPTSAAYGYLYVTNSDRLSQTATVDYTGTVVGNTRTFPCVPGINAAVLALGNTFELRSATHTIAGTVIAPGYNAGTGVLTFRVDAISAGSGNESWNLVQISPAFGSINVFEWDGTINPPVGVLTFLQTIYVPLSFPTWCFYDLDSDAVYVSCLGSQGVGQGLLRIDCASPFAVAASISTAPVLSINQLMDNPVTENLYVSGNAFNYILKLDKSLAPSPVGYDPTSNLTPADFLPPIPPGVGNLFLSRSHAKTVNPGTGVVYYSQYYSDEYKDYILKLDPAVVSLATKDTAGIFFKFNDAPNGEAGAGVYDMYYHASTQRLFVARYLSTGKFFFQSYDISSGVAATILTTIRNHPTPTVAIISVDGLCNSIINYQPGHDRILLMNDTVVFVFDPNTLSFESSYVVQPNFAENFSRTDDTVNNNFYGTAGSGWISVISQEPNTEDYFGEFDGEVTTYTRVAADNCQTEDQINTAISELKGICGCNDCGSEGDIGTPPNGNGATLYNIYYGRNAVSLLNESQILALTGVAQPNFAGNYLFSAISPSNYCHVCYPVSLGLPVSILDPSFGFPFDVIEPFPIVSVLGEPYYDISSENALGGAITMQLNQ